MNNILFDDKQSSVIPHRWTLWNKSCATLLIWLQLNKLILQLNVTQICQTKAIKTTSMPDRYHNSIDERIAVSMKTNWFGMSGCSS